MKLAITIVLALSATVSARAEDQSRFYDARGNSLGTAATTGNTTTFRDALGRTTGTATRLPDGRTEFRDARGRLTGTSGGR
jgi:YD repeat-containing protein